MRYKKGEKFIATFPGKYHRKIGRVLYENKKISNNSYNYRVVFVRENGTKYYTVYGDVYMEKLPKEFYREDKLKRILTIKTKKI